MIEVHHLYRITKSTGFFKEIGVKVGDVCICLDNDISFQHDKSTRRLYNGNWNEGRGDWWHISESDIEYIGVLYGE